MKKFKKKKKSLIRVFRGKKIIITGHTGFKGSWLTTWLNSLGANIVGISNNIPTKPSHFKTLEFKKNTLKSHFVDLRNLSIIKKIFKKERPDFVFHLAAEALVKRSYEFPVKTITTNIIGTLNVLEALKQLKNKNCAAVIITSDKVYKNLEISRGYKESDVLGGKDPYSASKASAEIIINSYINSFFPKFKSNVTIGVARAGNVIGGGDWSEDRLIPDCMKSWPRNKRVLLRNPNSTRPWQHVLDAIWGYIVLAKNLKNKKKLHGENFNFGPTSKSNHTVLKLVKTMNNYWKKVSWEIKKDSNNYFESNLLKLNSKKAKKLLGWRCAMNFTQTVKMVAEWYKFFYSKKNNKQNLTLSQIKQYEKILDL